MTRAASVLVLAAVLLIGGCTGGEDLSSHTVSDTGSALRLVVLDGSLRRLGDPCNGAGPFRLAHADTGYVIQDGAGAEVFRGELPNGTVVRATGTGLHAGAAGRVHCGPGGAVAGPARGARVLRVLL